MKELVSIFNDNEEDKNEDERLQKKMRLGYNKEAAETEKDKKTRKNRKEKKEEKNNSKFFKTTEFEIIKREIIEAFNKMEIKLLEVEKFPEEKYYGNTEYKLILTGATKDKVEHLASQMKFRLKEGDGTAYYYLGVEDNGNPLGLKEEDLIDTVSVIFKTAKKLGAEMKIVEVFQGKVGRLVHLMIGFPLKDKQKVEIRIILLGDFGVGKSTLFGCLLTGDKDDGTGLARMHAIKSNSKELKEVMKEAITSSVNQKILGIDDKGRITNAGNFGLPITINQIIERSQKIIRIIDVSGQEKYKKTYLRGLCSVYPDYALILISAKEEKSCQWKEHLLIAIDLNIPIIIVITKIDQVNSLQLDKTISDVKSVLKIVSEKLSGKNPLIANNKDDLVLYSKNMDIIIPIILISNVTLAGHDLLINLFNILPINEVWKEYHKQLTQFRITRIHTDKQKILLFGIIYRGQLTSKKNYVIGPFKNGEYKEIEIKSIYCMETPVNFAFAGQICSMQINFLEKGGSSFHADKLRTGMVILDPKASIYSTYYFEADIKSMDGLSSIQKNYQPIINTQNIRQAAKIIGTVERPKEIFSTTDVSKMDEDIKYEKTNLKIENEVEQKEKKIIDLETGITNNHSTNNLDNCDTINLSSVEYTRIKFCFVHYPEYIEECMNLIINDDKFKATGVIVKVNNRISQKGNPLTDSQK